MVFMNEDTDFHFNESLPVEKSAEMFFILVMSLRRLTTNLMITMTKMMTTYGMDCAYNCLNNFTLQDVAQYIYTYIYIILEN